MRGKVPITATLFNYWIYILSKSYHGPVLFEFVHYKQKYKFLFYIILSIEYR